MGLKKLVIFIIVIGLAFAIAFLCLCKVKRPEQKIPVETMISQMIVVGYDTSNQSLNNLKNNIADNKISGVIFYKRNIKNPEQLKLQIAQFNKISKSQYPLFMITDQEGGRVSRIADDNGFKIYPAAQTISNTHNKEEAYNIYHNMALSLKEVGINFNLAPCVDVKTNPKSSIGADLRIYGKSPEIVSDYALEFVKAHNDAKVITAIKHFPGLGNAQLDTHKSLPDITDTWNKTELVPFENIIEKYQKEPVLVGHVINKKLDSKNVSSFSPKTISLLTDKMNFKGVVIADAVDMSAIDNYDIKEFLIKSINSGVNLFIFPNHARNTNSSKIYMEPDNFIKIVEEALNSGKINKSTIENSYNKIIDLKRRFIIDETF